MIYYKIHDKAVTGKDFKTCLIEIKEATEAANIDNPIFILDNAKIYHYQGLQETIEELNLNTVYLLPYSPFLNPIENVFSVWKNLVLQGGTRFKTDLKRLISIKFTEITREHCNGFYRKMLHYIVKSERREIILE